MAMVLRRPNRSSRGTMQRGNSLRPVEWIRACYAEDALSTDLVGVSFQTLVSAADFDQFTRPTVVRLRGNVWVVFGDASANLNAQVVMGITIVNPGEPPPSPFIQARGNRWMWWHCDSYFATSPVIDGVSSSRVEFDVKSMRKRLVDGSQLMFIIHAVGAGPGPDGGYSVGCSTLVKE